MADMKVLPHSLQPAAPPPPPHLLQPPEGSILELLVLLWSVNVMDMNKWQCGDQDCYWSTGLLQVSGSNTGLPVYWSTGPMLAWWSASLLLVYWSSIYWSAGLELVYWSSFLLVLWSTAGLVFMCTGMLVYWSSSLLASQFTGLLVYWSISVLVCHSTGQLVCRSTAGLLLIYCWSTSLQVYWFAGLLLVF